MMKIIVDNNIWISFLIGKRLSSLKLLLCNNSCDIYICDELIQEFFDVVNRPKIQKYITQKDIDDTIKLMYRFCKKVSIATKAKSPIRDVNDLYLLSLSDTIKADYIISGDKDLLVLGNHHETKILTFSDFMTLLS
jgi:putative PIN family toxin of toxin-antitoxin system